jgi:hypothetical protein
MRRSLLAGLLFTWLLGSPGAAALQIDITALGAFPIGTLTDDEFGDSLDASDVFSTGFGVLGDVLFGLTESIYLGPAVGIFSVSENSSFFDPFDLTVVPLLGLLQWRTARPASLGFYVQGGAGLAYTSLDVPGFDSSSESSFAFLFGGGLSYALSDSWHLTTGLNYFQIQGSGSCFDFDEVFCEDDTPKWLLFTVGARFGRD